MLTYTLIEYMPLDPRWARVLDSDVAHDTVETGQYATSEILPLDAMAPVD